MNILKLQARLNNQPDSKPVVYRLPQSYTAGMLVRAIRTAKDEPHSFFETPEWRDRLSADGYIKWFRKCLDKKISREDQRKGRKFSPDYRRGLQRDARIINDAAKRVRISGRNLLSTPELRRKYPEINNHTGEIG